jgi:undecaprenyl-diphosphatase
MTGAQAVFLGVLQGLGEFLPISSSGHLIAVPWLLGWNDHSLSFDVALHLGTLFAVLYAFAGDWWRLTRSAVQGVKEGRVLADPGGRLLALLALASIPGAVAGLLLEDWAETTFRSPALVASTMAGMGVVLLVADRMGRGLHGTDGISTRHALLIGIAQAAAIVPGVSRSGATISMALLLGFRREEAARFSFLLATPITFGAALVKVPHLFATGDLSLVLPAMLAAMVVGFLSIRVLLSYVRTRDYSPFVYYRFAFAALIAVVLLARD